MGVMAQLIHSSGLPCEVADLVQGRTVDDLLVPSAGEAAAGQASSEPDIRVFQRLSLSLLELAKHRPLVVCVDDLHYADSASREVLLSLSRRLYQARILTVFAELPLPGRQPSVFRSELLRLPYARQIRLRQLSPGGVAELLAEALGTDGVECAAEYHAATGGSPLWLHALLEDRRVLDQFGSSGSPEDKPIAEETFVYAVSSFLQRCTPELRAVAQALAIFDALTPPALLSQLISLPVALIEQGEAHLTAAGLLDGGRFRHRAARDVVLDTLPLGRRSGLYARAAETLNAAGGQSSRIAELLVAAQEVPGGWAEQVLCDAAVLAQQDGRLGFGVSCLELVLRVCEDRQHAAVILAELERIRWQLDPAAGVQHLAPLSEALSAGHLGLGDAAMLVRNLLWQGRMDEAEGPLRWLARSDRKVVGGTGEGLALKDVAEVGFTHHWLRYTFPAVLERVGRTEDPLDGLDLSQLDNPKAQAASALAAVLGNSGTVEVFDRAEGVLRNTQLEGDAVEAVMSALFVLAQDDLGRAADWSDSLIEEATARRSPTWLVILKSIRADLAVRQGDMPLAKVLADAAISGMSKKSWGVAIWDPLASLVNALTAMGRTTEAAEQLRQPTPERMFESRYALHFLNARGCHYLAVDRPHMALSEFQRCGELMASWGLDLPVLQPWRSGAAAAHLQLGHRAEAKELIEQQLAALSPGSSRIRGVSLRLLARTSELERRPALLHEAASMLAGGGSRFALAMTLADLSSAYDALGNTPEARRIAQRALTLARVCQTERLCCQLLPPLQGFDRDEPPSQVLASGGLLVPELSAAEQKVAVLAAQGHTNREIARHLSVTASTVEQHLTRVYRKLGIKRRTDLPSWLTSGLAGTA
jgi:DNA-binding CsgD family transcriptional regulator